MNAPLPACAFPPTQSEAGADDRIYCRDCRNLPEHFCTAWREVKAIRGYTPDPDLPRRCNAYRPGRDEQDQRSGAQRWPTLDRVIEEPRRARR